MHGVKGVKEGCDGGSGLFFRAEGEGAGGVRVGDEGILRLSPRGQPGRMAAHNDKSVDGRGWGKVADALGVGSPQFGENFGGGRDVGVVDSTDWTSAFDDGAFCSADRW